MLLYDPKVKYLTGEEVLVGDQVDVCGSKGEVVYVIDTRQGSAAYPEGSWDYLEVGVMVETVEMGLVHYPELDDRLILLSRSN